MREKSRTQMSFQHPRDQDGSSPEIQREEAKEVGPKERAKGIRETTGVAMTNNMSKDLNNRGRLTARRTDGKCRKMKETTEVEETRGQAPTLTNQQVRQIRDTIAQPMHTTNENN